MLKIDELKDRIAHGSGIDSDWHINKVDIYYECENSYHVMNEMGMYIGWIDFMVRFDESFTIVDLTIDKEQSDCLQKEDPLLYLDDIEDYLWQTLEIIEE